MRALAFATNTQRLVPSAQAYLGGAFSPAGGPSAEDVPFGVLPNWSDHEKSPAID